jgi:hypothetical protein
LCAAAADGHQPGALESGSRDHKSWADVQAARHAIRFFEDDAGDTERLAADAKRVAGVDVQPCAEVGGNDRGVIRAQRIAQRGAVVKLHGAVERKFRRVHRLYGRKDRIGRTFGSDHRKCLGDAGIVNAALGE